MTETIIKPIPEADSAPASIIKVIGVGGGGGNAVGNMYGEHIEGVRFLVCNTDAKALESSPVPDRIQIGPGLGAGGQPEKGRQLAEEHLDDICRAFDGHTQMVFITAGMGGGTGTGAGPVVAREAMKRGILTIGIVTIPFLFEARKQIDKALDGVERMAKEVDALLVVNNERLKEVYADLSVINAFKKADDTLTKAVRSIVEIINMRGKMILDFRDVETCLRGGGVAIMSTGYGKGPNRMTKAIEDALHSPLLNDKEVQRSRSLRVAIFAPPEETGNGLMVDELNEIETFMSGFRDDVETKWGLTTDPALTDEVKVTLLASGFRLDNETDAPAEPRVLTPEQAEEMRRIEERRNRAYATSKTRTRHNRIHLFTLEDLDNETLVVQLDAIPTVRRTESDARHLRNISHNDTPIEVIL